MGRVISTRELWLRRFHPAPGASTRLVCLPHGGGSASFYFSMSQALSPHVDVLAVQYPGRQDRRDEPSLTDLHVMADHIADALDGWTDRPLTLFGHSMGSILAFEVARRLQDQDTRVRMLFLSGARPPHMVRDDGVHRLSNEGLVRHLKELKGTELSLLSDDEILPLILPVIRCDYTAVESYVYRDGPPLTCPILALVGDDDPAVSPDEGLGWAGYTAAPSDLLVFPGDHFYLIGEQKAVVAAIRERVAGLSPAR